VNSEEGYSAVKNQWEKGLLRETSCGRERRGELAMSEARMNGEERQLTVTKLYFTETATAGTVRIGSDGECIDDPWAYGNKSSSETRLR
jgi:hypothetical protein